KRGTTATADAPAGTHLRERVPPPWLPSRRATSLSDVTRAPACAGAGAGGGMWEQPFCRWAGVPTATSRDACATEW
ncbi:unnamed protein product, partial [Scytosiphon promiscuus]